MRPWQTLSRTVVFEQKPWISVESRELFLPDGKHIPGWIWLDTPDYIIVTAVDKQGRFLIFEQVKYAADRATLAPVGGYIRPGEDPLEAAKRELLEETGYRADSWEFLGDFITDANRGNGQGYLYLATGAEKVADVNSDDLEEQHQLLLTRDQVAEAVLTGRVRVITWQACLAMALLRLPE